MKGEIKHATEVISSHPNSTSLIAACMAWINAHWLDWGQPLVQALTSIAGLILVCVLIFKHLYDMWISKKRLESEINETGKDK